MSTQTRRVLWSALGLNALVITFATIGGLVNHGQADRYFGEGRLPTILSVLQIGITAFFSFRIFQVRKSQLGPFRWNTPCLLWLLIAAGFLFLLADEGFEIHEHLDSWANQMFTASGVGLGDRADDWIIFLYGLIGLAVLGYFRAELFRLSGMLRFLIPGFGFFFLMVVGDLSSHHDYPVYGRLLEPETAETVRQWIGVFESTTMLVAEALFVTGFARGLELARQLSPPASQE